MKGKGSPGALVQPELDRAVGRLSELPNGRDGRAGRRVEVAAVVGEGRHSAIAILR